MLSFAGMLLAPSPAPLGTPKKRKAPVGGPNARRARAEARYRLFLEGEVLPTPVLAAKLGCVSSANISKTLKAMAQRGLVKHVGKAPRVGAHGKPADLWTWAK